MRRSRGARSCARRPRRRRGRRRPGGRLGLRKPPRARIGEPRRGADVLLCAHLDTVAAARRRSSRCCEEGVWRNRQRGDPRRRQQGGRRGVLELARRLDASAPPGRPSSCCSPSCEENALAGAKAFDVGRAAQPLRLRVRPRLADRRGRRSPRRPTTASRPSFRGAAAHAGIRPEDGPQRDRRRRARRSAAMRARPARRGDDRERRPIAGGSASTNVVPERCRVEAEARSLDDGARPRRSWRRWSTTCTTAPTPPSATSTSPSQRLFHGYRTRPSAPAVAAAEAALRACGYEPRRIVTGGGSDANAFEARRASPA